MTIQPKHPDLDLVDLSRYTQLHIEMIQRPAPNNTQASTHAVSQVVVEQALASLKLSERSTSKENVSPTSCLKSGLVESHPVQSGLVESGLVAITDKRLGERR